MKRLFCILSLLLIFSCSSDKDETDPIIEDVFGTVVGQVACHSTNNGLTYEIQINNLDEPAFIITPSLPPEYKEEGLRIKFGMRNTTDNIGACVNIYGPAHFYEIYDIRLLE